ncbi:MAG: hypothetical protein ABSH31_01085 [Bryobacteraceae bacterium]|jgi:hypothetical protein
MLVDHLAGKWLLEGTIACKKTTHNVEADWVLGHQYLRIHAVSREKTEGKPSYEATVFIGWDQASAQYACVWLDTYGGMTPVSFANAKRNGNEIPFLFPDKEAPLHTTFSYIPASDSWTWSIDNEEKGKLIPFARVSLIRQPGK